MFLNNTPLYIGTSGYNHADWKGTFAPKDIDNFDLLSFYANKGFNFLELTFTFYRMPEPDKILHIVNRTGDTIRRCIHVALSRRSEIRNQRPALIRDQNIGWLQVLVDESLPMNISEPKNDPTDHNRNRRTRPEWRAAIPSDISQNLLQRTPRCVFQMDLSPPSRTREDATQHTDHANMIQTCKCLDFASKD
jgi:hypothetical protein